METPDINLDWVMAVTDEFTGQHNIIPIPRTFVEWLGDYHCAALLNQIIYWSSPRRNKREGGWFYKSAAEWLEELGLTEYQIRRATKVLTEKAGVETKRGQVAGGGTPNFYRLNRAKFSDSYLKFLQDRKLSNSSIEAAKTADTYTETTPEPTAEREIAPAPVGISRNSPVTANRDMAPITPGMIVTARPDAPKLRAVPKFAQTPEFAATLAELLRVWPLRDGAGPNPKLTERALVLVAPTEYPAVLAGARRVAAGKDAREGVVKNLHTWLADEDWRRYAVGARPTPGAVYANGKRA